MPVSACNAINVGPNDGDGGNTTTYELGTVTIASMASFSSEQDSLASAENFPRGGKPVKTTF